MFSVLVATLSVHAIRADTVFATGNLYQDRPTCNAGAESACGCQCSAQHIDPLALFHEVPAVQKDTFEGVVTKSHLGVQVPVYHFRQPSRLSHLELPFKLVLLRNLGAASGVVEVPVDMKQAVDSWFPDYYWGYLLICTECSTPVHLGWKFVPKHKADSSTSFYALIVDYTDDRKQRVATHMGVMVDVVEELRIGVTAPSWMVAMLATHLSINGAAKV